MQLGVQKVSIIQSSSVPAIQNILKSIEKWLRLSELLVILWVSTAEGCLLSELPLYEKRGNSKEQTTHSSTIRLHYNWRYWLSLNLTVAPQQHVMSV